MLHASARKARVDGSSTMADISLANGRTASTTGQDTAFAVVQWAKRRLRFELSEQLEEFLERTEKAPIRARRAEHGWRLLRAR